MFLRLFSFFLEHFAETCAVIPDLRTSRGIIALGFYACCLSLLWNKPPTKEKSSWPFAEPTFLVVLFGALMSLLVLPWEPMSLLSIFCEPRSVFVMQPTALIFSFSVGWTPMSLVPVRNWASIVPSSCCWEPESLIIYRNQERYTIFVVLLTVSRQFFLNYFFNITWQIPPNITQ